MAAPTARPKKRGTATPVKLRHPVTQMRKSGEPGESDVLLDACEVSAIIGVAVRTLSDWRYRNRHLPYYRLGNHVRYDASDIAAFLARHREEIDPDGVLTAREVATLARHLGKVRSLLATHPELSAAAFIHNGGLMNPRFMA